MAGKRAATPLLRRHHHLASVRRKYANRRLVQFAESYICDAAREKSYASPPFAGGRKDLSQFTKKESFINCWQQPLALRKSKQFQNAGSSRNRLQARALVETKQLCRHGNSFWKRDQPVENKFPRDARKPWPPVFAFNPLPRVLHQLAVLNP